MRLCKLLLILFLLFALTTACSTLSEEASSAATSAPASAPAAAAFSAEQLMNAEYAAPSTATGFARLENGTAMADIVPGSAEKMMITFTGAYALGDLDGDGDDDAAVILATQTGGSGVFISLDALRNEGGQPMPWATFVLGDRVLVNAVTVQGGRVTLDMVVHGADDAFCCPSQPATRVFHIEGDAWVEETP